MVLPWRHHGPENGMMLYIKRHSGQFIIWYDIKIFVGFIALYISASWRHILFFLLADHFNGVIVLISQLCRSGGKDDNNSANIAALIY